MNVASAWAVLGRDWAAIVKDMADQPDTPSKVTRAEELLAEAKKLARKLMAEHHPDRNPDDPDATIRFQAASAALATIEADTAQLRSRYQEMQRRAEQLAKKRAKDGFIVIK